MKKFAPSLFSAFFIALLIYLVFYSMMPQSVSNRTIPLSEFSTKRALQQIAILSKAPHYVGSDNHKVVANYLENELRKLGLETQIQEGYTLSDWGNLVQSKNIIARIKGSNSSKALLLLSHYDSAPHSKSKGASDDGAGIATILEGVRAFLHNKTPHKNDIIILFSDAEELGLNGAALFVKHNKWAKDVGLVLNFEARGSAGPSYMLMEVNNGNHELIRHFSNAKVPYPVSNSLMYSIYKMLPNDTDLTVFREQSAIQGFNFAFIDDHFNYHTSQDDLQHLSQKTLEHQGTYFMPLLHYFSNTNLKNLASNQDDVYFNTPFNFVIYPFSYNFPIAILAAIIFSILLFVGFGKRILDIKIIAKGFLLFFGALLISTLITFLGWKFMLQIYPQYKDILQGFTYNGHYYIGAFVFLSLAICFWMYRKKTAAKEIPNLVIAPLLCWIIVGFITAAYLPGAGFFIIPVFAFLIGFAFFIITQKTNIALNLVLSIPSLIIIVPFIIMFPIGLGLKILFGSAILVVLTFGLLLPIFGTFFRKGLWSIAMLFISFVFFVFAHYNSNYSVGKAKPNSLIYLYDADKNTAIWATYDKNLDVWTKKYLGENPEKASTINRNSFFSKYDSKFTFTKNAPVKDLENPKIELLKDSVIGKQRHIKIRISPSRKVNRYDIFANQKIIIYNFIANGAKALNQKNSIYERKGIKILTYYVVDNQPLDIEFDIDKNALLDMDLMESSFDLLNHNAFFMEQRKPWMMPTPFVLNDAVIIQQKIRQSVPKPEIKFQNPKISESVVIDTILK